MNQILVTGGAGFIGSHLCESLLLKGNHVICVDNLSTGTLHNIQRFENHDNFQFIRHDVIHPLDINIKVDEIYHLACPASPKDYQSDPIKTIQTNVIGTMNMLDLALKNRSKILLTSTSEVYGNPMVSPQYEEYWGNVNPIGVRSCYDEGKRLAECLMIEYHRIHHLETHIARIFNTYGPHLRCDDGRVVSNFIVQALSNRPITIYGNGNQTRSFCYIDDLVKGLIALMRSDYNEPINLGNPEELTIKELAFIIQEMTASKSEIVFYDLPKDDPIRRKPDIEKAKKILNWQPSFSIRDGLVSTISYFKKLNKK